MESRWFWLAGLVLSLGGLTVLFPLLATLCFQILRIGRLTDLKPPGLPSVIEILIPAFNEADIIQRTLESVWRASQKLVLLNPQYSVKIKVGLDGPSDSTPRLVQEFLSSTQSSVQSPSQVSFQVINRVENRGKWNTLVELVYQSHGSWTALVDSGTLWPEDFLTALCSRFELSNSVGIAPGYRPEKGGLLSRLIWWQERVIKSIENGAGGPISLHGATLIFRTEYLKRAMNDLSRKSWLNDDVVIGLTLRKWGQIEYLGHSLQVTDCGVRIGASDLGRRKRILRGNLEWMSDLFLSDLSGWMVAKPVITLLIFRRIARILWAYALLMAVFSLSMGISLHVGLSLVATAIVFALMLSKKSLREPAWVSLSIPFFVLNKDDAKTWS